MPPLCMSSGYGSFRNARAGSHRIRDFSTCLNIVTENASIIRPVQEQHGGYATRRKFSGRHDHFQVQRPVVSESSLLAALKACGNARNLNDGRKNHADAIRNGADSGIFVASALIRMYAKCGCMVHARQVFDRIPRHDLVSWSALIHGYAENRQDELALELFVNMQAQGYVPDARTFVAALVACSNLAGNEDGKQVEGKLVKLVSLEKGMAVHAEAAKQGCDTDVFLASTLAKMYSKCGSMVDARRVFDRMQEHDSVSCASLLLGYAENGEEGTALELFAFFQDKGCLMAALKACISLAVKEEAKQVDEMLLKVKALEAGRVIHRQATEKGHVSDLRIACSLLNMYSKCGSLRESRDFFETMQVHDVVAWNTLLTGYVENEDSEMVLGLFERMKQEGVTPNSRTFVSVLKACSHLARKEEGTQIGEKLVKLGALEKGMGVHSEALKHGCTSDAFLSNTLVDMYAKCGSLVDAQRVFDVMRERSVVSWNTLILGYVEAGEEQVALDLFSVMQDQGCAPVARTFVAALDACVGLAAKEEGRQIDGKLVKLLPLAKGTKIHYEAAKTGCDLGIYVGCSLINMYAKCGSLEDAQAVFNRMPHRDVVSWNSLLLGYAENGQAEATLELYSQMQREGCEANAATFVSVLKACTAMVAVETGRALHACICRTGLEDDLVLATCLVDLYAKSSSMVTAQYLVDSLSERNTVIWSALIAGYSQIGDAKRVLEHLESMEAEGLQPNSVTMVGVLAACSHSGLVEKGRDYFEKMWSKYGVRPGIDHYHCVIDMLGRADQLEQAVAMVRSMPYEPNSVTWKTILGACCKWKNVELGRLAFEALIMLDVGDLAAYSLMANVYGSRGMWEEQSQVEALKRLPF